MTNVDRHRVNWREQKKQRLRLGDSLDEPRELDHFMIFRKKSHAVAAAKTLEAAGFRVTVVAGLLRATVEATRADALGDEDVARVLREVVDIAEAHHGSYDGFGGAVVSGLGES